MSNSLKDIQERFQQSVLNQDNTIIDDIRDTKKESRHVLLNVYQHAYGARLEEFLQNDFPMTLLYLGEDSFSELARAYYKAHPSDNPNARWFGRHFTQFLKNNPNLKDHPECYELAELEAALGKAFDAKDSTPLTTEILSRLAPEEWPTLTFTHHPSTSRLRQTTGATDIWTALNKEQSPPDPIQKTMPIEVIVWRGDDVARFRPMAYDEAMIWDEAGKGANFAALCEMLGTYWPDEEAPLKAAGYLQAWLISDFLTAN